MPGSQYDLCNNKISETFHRVVQYESSSNIFLDGRGDPIDDVNLDWSGTIVLDGTASIGYIENSQIVNIENDILDLQISSSSIAIEIEELQQCCSESVVRIGLLESGSTGNEGLWTGSWGSGDSINRESDVYITGSLYVSGTFYGESECCINLSSSLSILSSSFENFSSSIKQDFTSSYWTGSSVGYIERNSDVIITGSLIVSDNINGNLVGTSSWTDNVVTKLFQAVNYTTQSINSINPNAILWNEHQLIDDIYYNEIGSSIVSASVSGWYDVSYVLNHVKSGTTRTSIQSVLRLNGFTNIQESLVISYKRNATVEDATSNVWRGLIKLNSGDYIELIALNAGGDLSGSVNLTPSSSILTMELKRKI